MSLPLPDLLRTKPLDRPMNQVYTTEVLRPVNFSQNGARFIISPNGLWSAESSQLIFRMTLADAAGDPVAGSNTYPSSCGGVSIISRSYVEIGGRRISSLENTASYLTFRRLHYSPDYKKQVMTPKQCGDDTFYGSGPRAQPIQPDTADVAVGGWGSVGRKPSSLTDPLVTGLDSDVPVRYKLGSRVNVGTTTLVDADANNLTVECSINIGQQLIPFLRGLQLPVFAIKEQVSLVVEFSQDLTGVQDGGGYRWVGEEGTTPAVVVSHIDQDSFMVASDHLMFPGAMESIAEVIQGPKGYNVTFDEVIQSVVNEAGAVGPHSYSHQLGLGGKLVKSIVVQERQMNRDGQSLGEKMYLGQYHSDAFAEPSTYNFQVDSVPYYALAIRNESTKYSEASHIDRVPLQMPMCQYALSPNQTDDNDAAQELLSGFTARLYQGERQSAVDTGSQHWTGVDFTNSEGVGRRMSNVPVLLNRDYVAAAGVESDGNCEVRTYTTTSRVCHLKNGLVNIVE